MKATVTRKYGNKEIYVMTSMGETSLDSTNLEDQDIKKGDRFEGYHAGGSFVAEKRI